MIHLVGTEVLATRRASCVPKGECPKEGQFLGKHLKLGHREAERRTKSAHRHGKTIQGHCPPVSESCQQSSTGVASCTRAVRAAPRRPVGDGACLAACAAGLLNRGIVARENMAQELALSD